MNTLRVIVFAICFRPLKRRYPSLFDGAVAGEEIRLAIASTTTIEPLENA